MNPSTNSEEDMLAAVVRSLKLDYLMGGSWKKYRRLGLEEMLKIDETQPDQSPTEQTVSELDSAPIVRPEDFETVQTSNPSLCRPQGCWRRCTLEAH
jgi:hypothetical protein